jgi:thiamine pyrophosphate-dependent acetolactate synthase large subunit-like protein
MKVSSAVAESLRREGIEVIFGHPSKAVLEETAATGIRPVIVRQEHTGVRTGDGCETGLPRQAARQCVGRCSHRLHRMAVELPIVPPATQRFRVADVLGGYAAFAPAPGAIGERLEKPGDFVTAIEHAVATTQAGVPPLLEFMTAREMRASRL